MRLKDLKLNNIRTKLIISLVAICIIPLLITGISSYNKSKGILEKKLSVTSAQTLNEMNSGLNNYFEAYEDFISLTAENYDITDVDVDDNIKYVPDLLKRIKNCDDDILSVYYGTASGKFNNQPYVKMPDGYDSTTRPWYKQAVENKGNVIITHPYKDASTGDNVITIAKTVEKNGQVVGVVALDCTLATLSQKMAEKQLGDTGYVYIIDTDGTIIAHKDKTLINTPSSIFDKVGSGDNGFIKYTLDGVNKFAVYKVNQLTGWRIVSVMQEAELTKDTKAILFNDSLIMLIMLIIAVIMSLRLSKGISNNINKLKEVFSKASDGDLTVSMTASTKDEFNDLALSFNSMMKNVSTLMNNVTKSSNTVLETSTSLASMSEEITASITEVAKAITDVAQGATEQVENAHRGVFEIEALSKDLDNINKNSNEMHNISNNTKDLSSKGLSMIKTLTEKSNKTKTSTIQVIEIVQDMNKSTKQINTISDTISSITEQTNLLSLNASIESARAGEAGRGFAVVANEIRKLAEQSKTATTEIKKIINNVQQKSDIAVKAIAETEEVVNEQEVAVEQTQQIFNEISKSIEAMISKVDEIKSATVSIDKKKQSTITQIENVSFISEQTASASEEVTASTEEITATIEELAKHSNELQLLAEQLGAEINKFKINK